MEWSGKGAVVSPEIETDYSRVVRVVHDCVARERWSRLRLKHLLSLLQSE